MSDEPEYEEIESTEEADSDHSESELSLAELSEAYASVLKQNRDEGAVEPDDVEQSDDDGEPPEVVENELAHTEKRGAQPTIQEMDTADNAVCPISPKSIVESLLFVGAPAGEKLNPKKIAALMRDVSPKEVKQAIKELNQDYEKRESAFRAVIEDGNCKLKLCDDLIDVQNFFFGRNKAAKLSQGAIDVLSVVAYHQPVSKPKLEKIRKQTSGSVLSQLLKRDLIEVVAETESAEAESGKQTSKTKTEKLYQTTSRFLKLFGLESLKDLPQTSVVSDLEELADY